LVALLLAELVVLSLRFDSGSLRRDHQWWAELVRGTRVVPQLMIAVFLGIVVLGGRRGTPELRSLLDRPERTSTWWLFLIGHLSAFAVLFQLTAVVLEGDIRSTAHPELWVLTWLGIALLTGALWAGAVLPPAVWWALFRHAGGLLLLGAAVGGLALWAGQMTTRLWEPLGQGTMWLVHLLLSGLFTDVVWVPSEWIIGTSRFNVEIAKQCSGYEGIGLIWIVLSFYLWFFRKTLRFPQALLLLPLGTAVIWLANGVRIVALIALGNVAPAVALAGFHSQAGWIAFNVVVLGLVAATRHSRFLTRTDDVAPPASGSATVAFLAPLFVILATISITGAFAVDVDWLYPLRVLTGALALWAFRRHYAGLGWGSSGTAVAIGVGVFVLWVALQPAASGASTDLLERGKQWAGPVGAVAWLLVRVLGSVVVIPLAEELAFRGYLTRRLQAADFQEVPPGRFSWFSFLASSVLFGALHSHFHFLAGTLAGMAYALALYRRGKIGDAIVAHATTNALIAAYVLAAGRWSLWN
jgi:exosortase E/protease (VPEID-CTERM system)